jgi:hypothetical protein
MCTTGQTFAPRLTILIRDGALMPAPAEGLRRATVVFGTNHRPLDDDDRIARLLGASQEDEMTAPHSPSANLLEIPFGRRWSQWLANNACHDATLLRRAQAFLVLAGCGLAAWLVTAIYLR